MNKIIAVAALMASFAANASDLCIDISGAARVVMHTRLSGVDKRTQVEIAKQNAIGDDLTILSGLINDAYSIKVSGTKEQAEQDFAVYWLLKCMRAERGML